MSSLKIKEITSNEYLLRAICLVVTQIFKDESPGLANDSEYPSDCRVHCNIHSTLFLTPAVMLSGDDVTDVTLIRLKVTRYSQIIKYRFSRLSVIVSVLQYNSLLLLKSIV